MAVTIRDVASEANVSATTVSRVFNHTELVNPETREQVMQVARRLGYQPNATARSLSHGRTQTIGVVLPVPHGEFFSEIIRGIDEVAHAAEHYMLISSSHYSLSESESALAALRGRVDGLLVMTTHVEAKALLKQMALNVPVVFMNSAVKGESYDAFDIENRGGAYAAVKHLVECGHERIAVIQGPADSLDVVERMEGYRDALTDAGLDPDAQDVIRGDFTQKSGYEAGQQILELDVLPDAVFSCNDYMAIGAMASLQEAGVRIPHDLAIAGFDDIPSARYSSPSLTTVRVPVYELGRKAAERLLKRIQQQEVEAEKEQIVPSELIIRTSTNRR